MEMLLSVAWMVVVIAVRRESLGALVQRVRQKRPPPDCEWLDRPTPGICSQHCAVLKARPAPRMLSSPPCSRISTAPPPAPSGAGLGPQASLQSLIVQLSERAEAVQLPDRVGLSWAVAREARRLTAIASEAAAIARTPRSASITGPIRRTCTPPEP